MKRRNFLKKLPILGAIPFTLNGIPFQTMANAAPLQRLASTSTNDRVLVIIQMHGGNDGINTVIPIADYDRYYFARPNIAIPENGTRKFITLDSTLAGNAQVGLHPDMLGMKELYDLGKLRIMQGVSYENNNGSHFRGRDILFMGGGSNDYINSGWVGRYLKEDFAPKQYPDEFPNADMLDPLALEFGNDISLIFHQEGNIPTSISINDPESFFNLVEELPGFEDIEGIDPRGIPPATLNDSPYGKELNWILGLEEKSNDYAARLQQVYQIGKQATPPNVTYPSVYPFIAPRGAKNNPLTGQLKIIANLLSGGCKTKVFLVKMGGFDTHADQVEAYNPTMGSHAALVYHIASAMRAFQDDLKERGLEDKVLSITTSEFGRRIYSNGAYGTDHGSGSPMMIFGKWVNPGVSGVNPDLTKGNVEMQVDYRQIYASILKDWMGVDAALVDNEMGILWGNYQGFGQTLPIIANTVTSNETFIQDRFYLKGCFPNPANGEVTIPFYINSYTKVQLKIVDLDGNDVKIVLDEFRQAGEHKIKVDIRDLPSGTYIYRINAGLLKDAKKLVVVN